jgi:hypothetical protein
MEACMPDKSARAFAIRAAALAAVLLIPVVGTHYMRRSPENPPGRVYCSTLNSARPGERWQATSNGLFYSGNGGRTWVRQDIGNAVAVRVWDLGPGTPVFVDTLHDGLYRSVSGTRGWARASAGLPHSIGASPVAAVAAMAASPADPRRVYCATEVEGIFRSEDQGRTWVPAHGGLPLPLPHRTEYPLLAVDPADADWLYTVLLVPVHSHLQQRTLYRSANGGRDWVPLKRLGRHAFIESMSVLPAKVVQLAAGQQKMLVRDPDPPVAVNAGAAATPAPEDVEAPIPAPRDYDVDGVAVLHDDGTLLIHPFDLDRKSLEFRPTATGGYDIAVGESHLQQDQGVRVVFSDDDSIYRQVPFTFRFYGRPYQTIFINSNGNVTFGMPDRSGYWSESAFLGGPPRIAPLWGDLNPAGGDGMFIKSSPDQLTITWKKIPEYGAKNGNTFQLVLSPDGVIRFHYDGMAATEGISGISSGYAERGLLVPFTSMAAWEGLAPASVYQQFTTLQLDLVAVSRRFYRSHEDDYDGLFVFGGGISGADIAGGAFAYSVGIRNETRGVGESVVDYTAEVGSAGRLQRFINMNNVSKYPDNIPERLKGLNHSVLSLLGEEWGHRFLAYVDYRLSGVSSDTLLGRDYDHWSYFLNSEASFNEGNEWRAETEGRFTALDESRRYGSLDQYLMGLRSAGDVGTVMLISEPMSVLSGNIEQITSAFGLENNSIRDSKTNFGTPDRLRGFMLNIGPSDTELWSYYGAYILQSGRTDAASDTSQLSAGFDLKKYRGAKVGQQYSIAKARDSLPGSRYYDPATGMFSGDPITIQGRRLDIQIEQIIECEGERYPAIGQEQAEFRHAFALIVPAGKTASKADIAKVAAIRKAWEPFYSTATSQRGSVVTDLDFGLTAVAPTIYGGGVRLYGGNIQGESTSVGYAALESSKVPASGAIMMASRSNGDVISEAAVPAAGTLRRARCYAEISPSVNTGVAIVAPEGQAGLSLELRDMAGQVVASASSALAGRTQTARFVRELFPGAAIGETFKGSITVTASSPVAVLALRTLLNEAGEFLITTQTVADLDAVPSAAPLYLPQIVAGGGYTTEVLLVNPSSSALTGNLEFRNSEGKLQDMGIPQASGGTVEYRLAAHGSQVFKTEAGASAAARSGYLVLRPTAGQPVPVTGAVFTFALNNRTVTTTGVSPAPVSGKVRFFADRRTNYDTGMAFVNTGSQPATVRFTPLNSGGVARGASRQRTVAPGAQSALFVSELMPDLPEGFRGTVLVESDAPLAMLALHAANLANRFLLAALPVSDLLVSGASGTSFFPHLADGGGYSSEFVVVNPGTDTANPTLRFYSSAGKPLRLVSR